MTLANCYGAGNLPIGSGSLMKINGHWHCIMFF